MTTLCPVCNNTLDRKYSEALEEDVLRCRVCRVYSLEGFDRWFSEADVKLFRKLAKQRDDDNARLQLMMETPIEHPIWTRIV